MLKLTYIPTSEITESDLVPGSKWRRVRDENGPLKEPYECVLIQHDRYWAIYRDWVACCAVGVCSGTLHNADEMLTWLSRDFERVGEENTKLGDIEIGHAAIHPSGDVVVVGGDRFEDGQRWIKWTCLKSGHQSSALSDVKFRDLGPIEIDESVKGVG